MSSAVACSLTPKMSQVLRMRLAFDVWRTGGEMTERSIFGASVSHGWAFSP